MRVLVACEFSGIERDAFAAKGHDAWSCDLLPSERPGQHIQGDVLEHLGDGWDLMIAHPPCVHLAVSGALHFKNKQDGRQSEALEFVRRLLNAPIAKIALENPVSIISTRIRKPDQIIQPYMFGHPERKTTCLWLRGLPKLVETNNVKAQFDALPENKKNPRHYLPPSKDRWKLRSLAYPGIAQAMADQWG